VLEIDGKSHEAPKAEEVVLFMALDFVYLQWYLS